LLNDVHVALGDGVGIEVAVGRRIGSLVAAARGIALAAVDDEERNVDALPLRGRAK
jgi:hypothetical protein